MVVRARDRSLDLDVAIKVLRGDLADERRWAERLAREVKTTRGIRHPNVCRVFDFQHADGQAFIVMELARQSLADEMNAAPGGTRSAEQRLTDVRAIASGLAAVHAAGVIHRDVSTRNILRLFDGRLVLSDLGLAIEVGEVAATLSGGTVAYMAPELAAGGRASIASDIWALGIVMYEVFFGERPAWRDDAVVRGMNPPGRRLTAIEDAVLAVCRQCTAAVPTARFQTVASVLERLSRPRNPPRVRGRYLAPIAVMLVVAAGVLGVQKATRRSNPQRATPSSEAPIEMTGVPRDWTQTSRLLATIPDKVACMIALPDRRTLRVVWGAPRIAEDIDVSTGLRARSPLVPAAYANGCPDLSPDGHTLIYQGYDAAGRAEIVQSPHADGSGGIFLVPAADPSVLSEPRWFAGGRAFVFDADGRHYGVVDRLTARPTILPASLERDDYSMFRTVAGDRVVWVRHQGGDVFIADAVSWPGLVREVPFTFRGITMTWESAANGRTFYAAELQGPALVEIDPEHHSAIRIGIVRDRYLGMPRVVGAGLAFYAATESSDVWTTGEGSAARQLTHDGTIRQVDACANGDLLVTREGASTEMDFGRIDHSGTFHRLRSRFAYGPACAKLTPNEWWYSDISGSRPVTYHCDGERCSVIAGGNYLANLLSPDETRIAWLTASNQGPLVQWTQSRGGGPIHDVAPSETNCTPVWASNDRLWVSRKRQGHLQWTEIDVATNQETGRTKDGLRDCTDARPDPAAPSESKYRVVAVYRSDIRWVPGSELPAPSSVVVDGDHGGAGPRP